MARPMLFIDTRQVLELIRVRNLRKTFGKRIILRDISFDVSQGEFFVILGPSASGKTTILRCIAGLEGITSGEILCEGKTISSSSTHIPPWDRGMAMVFQEPTLWPHMSVRENIAFGLRRCGLNRAGQERRVDEVMERLQLSRKLKSPIELSGGERQRVAFARALVARPGLLLLDEPFTSLNPGLKEEIQHKVREVLKEQKITTLCVTHDLQEASGLADRLAVLNDGHIEQTGPFREILRGPETDFVRDFVVKPMEGLSSWINVMKDER